MSSETERPLVCVVVNSSIYAAIKSSLDLYAIDIENSGFTVNVTETDQLLDKTPEAVRSHLQQASLNRLAGCVLVGEIPAAWFEVGGSKFPIDLYYMDLDGVWSDLDNNGVYDEHHGNVEPEIWVGRLKASDIAGDEVSLLNDYFHKNHRYRTGALTLPWWRALIYVDDRVTTPLETILSEAEKDIMYSFDQIYSDVTFVRDRATTNATDYKLRLADSSGYQWAYLMCHGTYHNHTFMIPCAEQESWYKWDGTVSSSDYRSIDPRVFFYHFVVCSATRYTEPDYLAGSAIFASTHGLLAVGSTTMLSTLPVSSFYGSLSLGKCIGTAFREWFTEIHEEYDYKRVWFYGLSMVGDPTLQLYRELHDVAVTDITASPSNVAGEETLHVTVTVENEGDRSETFSVVILYDFLTTFNSTYLTLPVGAKTTVTFSSTDVRFIFGSHKRHAVWAEVPPILGELDTEDNYRYTCFDGKIIQKSSTVYLSPIFLALALVAPFGLAAIFLLKMLMSERPRLPR